jgi:periplasmic divalent cation tolerance protein
MRDPDELEILSITTTVGSLADGQTLARQIIARRLAACVQVEQGLISFYRWQGEQCESAEVRLVIKTVPGGEVALQEFIAHHHTYDLPQFLVVRMRASEAYAAWVRTETAAPPA